MLPFTKDQITLLRHGLDLICRSEANGLQQSGLTGLKNGNAKKLSERLALAVVTEAQLVAAFEELVAAETETETPPEPPEEKA